MEFDKNNMTIEQLAKLRREIVFGSIFINDYENSFDIDPQICCTFFDGFCDFIEELMIEDGYTDDDYWEIIDDYDTIENLYEWYLCCEYPFGEE